MNHYVKFTGKFTDLIPNGWTFQKLFARNYRQYHKTCDGEKYSQGCRIWQHCGGYLEIDGCLSDITTLIVDKIERGEINQWKSKVRFRGGEDEVFWLIVDGNTSIIHPHNSPEYIKIRKEEYALHDKLTNNEITKEEFGRQLDIYLKRYQKLSLQTELVDMVQDLVNKQWIKVVEDNRKP